MTRVRNTFYLVLSAVAFAAFCYMLVATSGCGARSILNKPPAQQQIKPTSPNVPTISTPDIPVELVDIDQDGTITAQERQSLMGDQPSVIGTFATIIGLVLVASIGSAWASAKWKPKDTPDSDEGSDGTRQLLAEQVHEYDFMGDGKSGDPEEPAAPKKQKESF